MTTTRAPHDPAKLDSRARGLLAALERSGTKLVTRGALLQAAVELAPELTELGREQAVARALEMVGLARLPAKEPEEQEDAEGESVAGLAVQERARPRETLAARARPAVRGPDPATLRIREVIREMLAADSGVAMPAIARELDTRKIPYNRGSLRTYHLPAVQRELGMMGTNGSGPGEHPGGSESRAHLEAESSPASNEVPVRAQQAASSVSPVSTGDARDEAMPGTRGSSTAPDAPGREGDAHDLLDRVLEREADEAEAMGAEGRLFGRAARADATEERRDSAPLPPLDFRPAPAKPAEPFVPRPYFETRQREDGTWHLQASGSLEWIQTMVDALQDAQAGDFWVAGGRP